jgi:hypothetical protein
MDARLADGLGAPKTGAVECCVNKWIGNEGAMQTIIDRYKGTRTPKGHDLRVDENPDGVTIWILFWGEYEGLDDHHHLGVARVRRERGKLALGVYRGKEQEPSTTRLYDSEEEVVAEIDKLVAQR